MTDPEVESALRPVNEVGDELGVDDRIGGSLASTILGVARSTIDADIACALGRQQVDSFGDALAPSFYVDRDRVRESVRRHSSFHLIHLDTMIEIDVFVRRPRAFDRECFRRAVERPIGEAPESRTYRFVTAEDSILLELEWSRDGGEVSERQWTDVLGVLQVQRSNLDLEYLHRWEAELGVDRLLGRALAASGVGPDVGPGAVDA